jgi:hypothetical protein
MTLLYHDQRQLEARKENLATHLIKHPARPGAWGLAILMKSNSFIEKPHSRAP